MSRRTSRCILERIGRVAALASMPFLLAASAFAGTFYSQGGLDATALSSWNSDRAGSGSAPADFASGDVFVVQGAHAMTLSATWTISGAGAALQIESGGALDVPSGTTLAVACPLANAGSLSVEGALRFDEGGSFDPGSAAAPVYSAGSTLAYANSGAVSVGGEWTGTGGAGAGVPSNLSLAGSGAVTLPPSDRGLAGSLALSSGTLVLNPTSGSLEVGGDWTAGAGAAFTPNGRTVRFNGSADQAVTSGGHAFADVTVAKPGGRLLLSDDLAVDGALTLTGGNVETGANVLVIASGGSVARTSGHVVGNLRKPIAAGASSTTFEIGNASSYAPVTVSGQGGGFNSAFDLAASTSAGDHAAIATSGIAADRSVNRTWSLAATGYTGGPFSLVCDFEPADLDAGAATSRFVIRRHSAGAWTATATGTRTATSTRATGTTAFGDFAVGEQAIDHYDVAAVSPQDAGSVFTTSVTARDVLNELVVDDNTTLVTMSSSGSAEFDADGNATFGDSVRALTAGTFGIATRDAVGETLTLTATDANSKTGSRTGLVILGPLSITTTSLPNGTVGDAYSQALAATGGTAPYGGWTVTVGTLPAGLSLDSGTGVISGTPTTAGTQAFTVQVSDAASHTATQALSITVGPALSVTTTSLPSGVVGDAYSQTLAATGGTAPYSGWTVTVGTLPAGLTLDSGTGVISGTPTTAGTQAFTIQVSDAASHTATQALSITVDPALSITTTSLPSGTVGDAYSQALAATGGTAPYSGWTVTVGTLPAGLTLDSGTGVISGTPTAAETQAFTVQVSDAASHTATQALSITVGPALSITTTSLPSGVVGDAYSQALAAAGGTAPYGGWTVTVGTLPAGLSLDGGTGVISGTPTTAETQAFTVQVSDAASHTATQALSITVGAGAATQLALVQSPANSVAGAVLAPGFSVRLRDAFGNDVPAAGVTVDVALTSGPGPLLGTVSRTTDPTGLVVFDDLVLQAAGAAQQLTASSTGLAPAASATFDVVHAAAASLQFVQQPTPALVGATISPAVTVRVRDAFANAVPGESVSLALVGTGSLGGNAPAAADASGIATFAGLTVSQAGTGNVLEATAGPLGPLASDPFDITCPVVTLAPASLPNATQGSAYSQALSASGGAAPYGYAVTAGSLPAGLSLAATGELTGTPTAAGPSGFTVTATDAFGCAGSLAYSLVVDSSCPAIDVLPATLPAASVSAAYAHSLGASGGTAPFSFAVTAGVLPAGLALSAAGSLTGTPGAPGPATFTVSVTDANLCSGSREYTLVVLPIPAAIADLSAQTVLSGNDGDGTAKITVTFTPPAGATTFEVYRAGFGGYPRYDNAGGAVPAVPSYPPPAPWTLTPVAASSQADEPATRDFWYYVAFAKNAAGGISAVSNRSAGALDYHLGDVSDGFTLGQGNNAVGNEDVSLLGANYGISEPLLTSRNVHYLDVGPTTDLMLSSRPFTDGRIDFEDFIVFATNFYVVSAPRYAGAPATGGDATTDELRVEAPATADAGQLITASLRLSGSGRVQGLSATLAWDATVVEPLAVEGGDWIATQGGLVLSPRAGVVDAALLGVRGQGLAGEGEVATVTFRTLRGGAPGIGLAQVSARDARNRPVELGATAIATGTPRVWATALAAPWPNPARGAATLEFALARAGRVDLAVFSVDGRRVKTLASGERQAGSWRTTWDGSDESGHAAAPGLYYAQLQAGGARFTRRLVLLR